MKNGIIRLRHELHRLPELSGREKATASRMLEHFSLLDPDDTVPGLGGHGVAFVFAGAAKGPTVLLRADLDALPITEAEGNPHRSENEGVAHLCGHDGHMTILADPAFAALEPDFCFALHNLPGFPLGSVVVREGTFSSASRGMAVVLKGRTAHAAQPETGCSPAPALARFIERMNDLPDGLVPPGETAFATVVGARLGDRAFGTSPGRAEIWLTLRSETDGTMDDLVGYAAETATREAVRAGLHVEVEYEDVFPAMVNAPEAVAVVRRVAGDDLIDLDKPLRWSEDFGRFTALYPGALFGLGAGEDTPALHDPAYDFPDALVSRGADLFTSILAELLG